MTAPPRRVLVIDDEPAIRALLYDMLTVVVGAQTVDVADSGLAGLELFARNRYDLVITDLLMPGLRGWQVAEAMRRQDPSLKLIMLTGSAGHDDLQRAHTSPFLVVPKPVHVEDFKRVVLQVLEEAGSGDR